MGPAGSNSALGELDLEGDHESGEPEMNEVADRRLTETVRVRRSARDLLTALMAERAILEARMPAGPQADPMKRVTGRSAMENAIASTRDMISAMDQLLSQLRGRGRSLHPRQ